MSEWLLRVVMQKVICEVLQPLVGLFQALSCYWKRLIHLLRKQKLHTKGEICFLCCEKLPQAGVLLRQLESCFSLLRL